jgi:hypothetical protein
MSSPLAEGYQIWLKRILYNLQKGIVDNTISTAAGLERESSFPTTHPALPYYQPTDISFGYKWQ